MAAFTKLEVKLISHTTKPQVHAKLSNEIPKKKKQSKERKCKINCTSQQNSRTKTKIEVFCLRASITEVGELAISELPALPSSLRFQFLALRIVTNLRRRRSRRHRKKEEEVNGNQSRQENAYTNPRNSMEF